VTEDLKTGCDCQGCKCLDKESASAIRYLLRQTSDAIRAGEIDLAENMVHRAQSELERYTGE
jgi:ribosomal protein S20